MRVILHTSLAMNGGSRAHGETVDLDDATARRLIAGRQARPADGQEDSAGRPGPQTAAVRPAQNAALRGKRSQREPSDR